MTGSQAGGTPGNGTCDHLITLKQTIHETRENDKTAYVIFLDVQKVYDKAWLDAILYALHQNGIHGKNLRLTKKLNSNFTARIQTRYGLTEPKEIKHRIRQGGVLSVIEYATLIDEIAKELQNRNLGIETDQDVIIDSLLWMDDVCLIHHDRNKLQKMLDITNHIARKYHTEFGAAKCKVVRIGRGPKSYLVLNGTTLEEVPTYKYLGYMINNKGDLTAYIKEIEGSVTAATQRILTETGNKEFKGMKMQAIWQLTDAVITPIITYGAESWDATKKEIEEILKILNNCLKTILCLPQGTPTQILLAETGCLPIQYYIYKKRIIQWHRIQKRKETALIKKITQGNSSTWKDNTIKIMNELIIPEEISLETKPTIKKN